MEEAVLIPWSGGECPLPPDIRINVAFRNGNFSFLPVRADSVRWDHNHPNPLNAQFDIVGYIVVQTH